MSCEHVEHNGERGTGSAAADKGRYSESERPRFNVYSIMMTSIWGTGLVGLLSLFLGILLGSTWTIQAVHQQHRRLAIQRRELNEWRLALQQTSVRCVQCGKLIVSSVGDYPDDGEDQHDDIW